MTLALATGFALGVASSAHCVAMCGPLVLTIGRMAGPSRSARLRQALLHHAGRTLVYALLALPAGLAGQAIVVQGFGRSVAVGTGLVLLASAASAVRRGTLDRLTARVSAGVARAFAPVLRWAAVHPIAGPLATGALNGVLPCGLVYAALAGAVASANPVAAVLVMVGFGAGTGAVLVALAAGAGSIPARWRVRLRPVGPVLIAVTAVILIARGLSAPHRHTGETVPVAHVHVHE